ncbi:uncharacterized protein LOC143250689 [Tachypleus tridentatus]|uniref:uncharacterized protein LOC143250689 n=1 Tax=Tachypleus tridentatus TaxID=6853 RepID=UPI003FD4C133
MSEMRTKCRTPILVCLCALFVCGRTVPIKNDSLAPDNLSLSIEEDDNPLLEKNQTLRLGIDFNTTDNTDGLFPEGQQEEVTTLDTYEHSEELDYNTTDNNDGLFPEEHQQEVSTFGTYELHKLQEATILAKKADKKINDKDELHDEVKDDKDSTIPLPTPEDKVNGKIPDEKELGINKNGEYLKPDNGKSRRDQEGMITEKEKSGQEKDGIIHNKKETTIKENGSQLDGKETTSDRSHSKPSKENSRPNVDHLYFSFKNSIDPLDASATESNASVANNITRKLSFFPSSLSFPSELNEYFKNFHGFYPQLSLNNNFYKEPNNTEFYSLFKNQNPPTFNYDFLRPLYYDKGSNIYNNPYDPFLDSQFSFHQPYRPHNPLRFDSGPLSHGGSKSVYGTPRNKIKGVQLVNGQIILIDGLGLPVRTDQTGSQTKPNLDSLENLQKDRTFKIKPFSPFHLQEERPISFRGKDFLSPYFNSPSSYGLFDRTIRPFDLNNAKYGFTTFLRPQYKTSDV